MARRQARKSGKKSSQNKVVLIGSILVGVLVLGVLYKSTIGSSSAQKTMSPSKDFKVANYRKDGSRFASVGNSYVFKGKVESIDTHGSDRLIVISIPGNVGERLPLYMPAENKSRINITRNDTFLFRVSCKTGRTEEGQQVKGILVVEHVETI